MSIGRRSLQAIGRVFSGAAVDTVPGALDGIPPLFLIGAPRSGTTLMCKLLRSHPAIFMSNESGVFLQMHHTIDAARKRRPAGLASGIESKEFYEDWGSYLEGRAPVCIRDFYARLIGAEGQETVRYWGDKHPHHDECMPSLLKWFPESRFIYLVRHPLDVTCSIAAMNRWDHAQSYRAWRGISRMYESHLPGIDQGRLFKLRYEDLVRDPRNRMQAVLSWLDVDASEETLLAVGRLMSVQSHAISREEEAAGRFKKGRAHDAEKQSIGRWANEIERQEADEYLRDASDFLARYYPEETVVRTEP